MAFLPAAAHVSSPWADDLGRLVLTGSKELQSAPERGRMRTAVNVHPHLATARSAGRIGMSSFFVVIPRERHVKSLTSTAGRGG
jgi:hypothetical protein